MKKIIYPALISMAIAFTSCKDYLDINQNPNSPSEEELTPSLLFPEVEMAYANEIGLGLRTISGYLVEYYAQYIGTENFVDISNFIIPATRTRYVYSDLYLRCLNNGGIVLRKAEEEGNWATYLAATVLMSQAYQTLVDAYGETPYTEALDPENPMPVYDDGATVYAGILSQLDYAIEKAQVNRSQMAATSFLVPGGTAADWIKVANALKLKIMMREHNVVNVKSELDALVAEGNFPNADVEWAGCWSNAAGKANPLYSEDFADWGAQKNLLLNAALSTTMNAYGDGRLAAYFLPAPGSTEYRGSISGTNLSTAAKPYSTVAYWSRPNINYNTPVSFISLAEIEFFLAEYYAEVANDMDTAAEYYKQAIKDSFASAGVQGAEAAISTYPFSANGWKKSLGVQKWVHLSGVNPFEGWCEVRRLKYPEFDKSAPADLMYDNTGNSAVDTSILTPGCLYTPLQVNPLVGDNTLVERFYYSNSSTDANSNVTKLQSLTTPIFWAK